MEKRKPHYPLADVKAQMTTVQEMNLTVSAKVGIRQAGMAASDALAVVCGLTQANFYKSMNTHTTMPFGRMCTTLRGTARRCM